MQSLIDDWTRDIEAMESAKRLLDQVRPLSVMEARIDTMRKCRDKLSRHVAVNGPSALIKKLERRIHKQRVALREQAKILNDWTLHKATPLQSMWFDKVKRQAEEIKRLRGLLNAKDGEHFIGDDFGNSWSKTCPKCDRPTMEVIGPGEAQCSECE